MLEARQKYIQAAPAPLGPVDLKTLAQFLLLGDPSVQPVESAPSQILPKTLTVSPANRKMFSTLLSGRSSRISRRKDLIANGLALARTWPSVRSRKSAPAPAMRAQLQKLAADMGLQDPSMFTFRPPRTRGATLHSAAQPKALTSRQADVKAVHVMLEAGAPPAGGIHRTTALVVREADGTVVSVHKRFAK